MTGGAEVVCVWVFGYVDMSDMTGVWLAGEELLLLW